MVRESRKQNMQPDPGASHGLDKADTQSSRLGTSVLQEAPLCSGEQDGRMRVRRRPYAGVITSRMGTQ